MRAFFVSGQKAQFNGVNPHTGEKRYKAVSAVQHEAGRKLRDLPKSTPGSYLDFAVNPTITALTSLGSVAGFDIQEAGQQKNINPSGLLDVLSVDFSRALKDLAAVLNDLKKVSTLGDLPITYDQAGNLRVHFAGCDSDTVETLCDELNIQRGIVTQDADFDAFAGTEVALLFPFAPSTAPSEHKDTIEQWFSEPPKRMGKREKVEWAGMLTPSDTSSASEISPDQFSTCSALSEDLCNEEFAYVEMSNPWDVEAASVSTPSGYETLHYSSPSTSSASRGRGRVNETEGPLEYQGFEGIYRFIEECDSARLRF